MAIANASDEDWKLLLSFFPPNWKELGQVTGALKGLRQDKKNDRKALGQFIGTVGAAGAAGMGLTSLLSRGATRAATQAAQAIPPAGGPPPPTAPPPGGLLAPIPGGPIPTPGQPQAPQPLIPSGNAAMTPNQQASQVRNEKFGAVANNLPSKFDQDYPHLPNFVKRMKEAGKSAEETYELAKQSPMLGQLVQKYEAQTGQSYLEKIKQSDQQQKVGAMAQFTAAKPEEQSVAPTKDSVVMTPEGAGTIHKAHGDNAYVEVDGKLKKVPSNELEQPPEDVVKAVSDILKIPEIDRSSNVSLFVYDPDESRAYFQFHDGSVYRYNDIDPQVVQDIAAKNATPITSGQNVYGAWSPEDPHGSLGAAFWAYLLKDPKYAKNKKGQPENPNYKKLQTLYDYWVKLRKRKK